MSLEYLGQFLIDMQFLLILKKCVNENELFWTSWRKLFNKNAMKSALELIFGARKELSYGELQIVGGTWLEKGEAF